MPPKKKTTRAKKKAQAKKTNVAQQAGTAGVPAALAVVMQKVNKKHGPGSLVLASKAVVLVTRRIPFGVFPLDVITGGGVPCGKIIRFYGPPQAGKSSSALKVLASAQLHCRWCALPLEGCDFFGEECECPKTKRAPMRGAVLDLEHRFDRLWGEKAGVDMGSLLVCQPTTSEESVDTANMLMTSGEVDFILVDSIASGSPAKEIGGSAKKSNPGLSARLNNQLVRIITGNQNRGSLVSDFKRPTVLLLTQLREKIGILFGNPETDTGGRGQKHGSSLDVDFRSYMCRKKGEDGKYIDGPLGDPTYAEVTATTMKNSTFPAMKQAKYLFYVQDDPVAGYRAMQTNDVESMLAMGIHYKLFGRDDGRVTLGGRVLDVDLASRKQEDLVAAIKTRPAFIDHMRRVVTGHALGVIRGNVDE